MKLASAAIVVGIFAAFAGCSSEELAGAPDGLDPAHVRTVHGHGFAVVDDGSLEPAEEAALFQELGDARTKILAFLKKGAAPGDFRTWDERHVAACAGPVEPAAASATPPTPGSPGEIRVVVQRRGGRCHADETGLTILRSHLSRRDATHELVHYLAGGAWRPADEGLAVYLTEKLWGPAWGVSVDLRSRVYMDLNMDDSLTRDRLAADMSRRDYDSAASFVKYLIEERGGVEKFLELYRGAPGDYHSVYGISEQELFASWRQKILAIDVKQSSAYYRFKDYLTNLRSG
jgi:hypothetical protein